MIQNLDKKMTTKVDVTKTGSELKNEAKRLLLLSADQFEAQIESIQKRNESVPDYVWKNAGVSYSRLYTLEPAKYEEQMCDRFKRFVQSSSDKKEAEHVESVRAAHCDRNIRMSPSSSPSPTPSEGGKKGKGKGKNGGGKNGKGQKRKL
mmetsp:Transcript_29303/g.75530  ORF Transcript_29303/g.75530 Transcript_29303/m.75530 type:complete len:149 (-) Transcript_29303:214-660(-)